MTKEVPEWWQGVFGKGGRDVIIQKLQCEVTFATSYWADSPNMLFVSNAKL